MFVPRSCWCVELLPPLLIRRVGKLELELAVCALQFVLALEPLFSKPLLGEGDLEF